MRKPMTIVSTVLAVLVSTAIPAAAQSSEPAGTYVWHGELVALDQSGGTVTLKSRLVDEARTQVKNFKAGARVLLHLSGFDTSADAIRAVLPYESKKASSDRFLVPAELVTPEVQNDYATFRIHVPAATLAQVNALKAGEWITVTSRHRPAADTEAIVAVHPYVKKSEATGTTTS